MKTTENETVLKRNKNLCTYAEDVYPIVYSKNNLYTDKTDKKYWRKYSEYAEKLEIYNLCNDYCAKVIFKMKPYIDIIFKNEDKNKKLTNMINNYEAFYNLDKANRLRRNIVPPNITLLTKAAAILAEDVQGYVAFSMDSESPLDEIYIRKVISKLTNTELVCVSYVSEFNKNLTEDFINDLMYISSNKYDVLNGVNDSFVIDFQEKLNNFYKQKEEAGYNNSNQKLEYLTSFSFERININDFSNEFKERNMYTILHDTRYNVVKPFSNEDEDDNSDSDNEFGEFEC